MKTSPFPPPVTFTALSSGRYLPSALEMATLDADTIAGGVPADVLMERAGKEMAKVIQGAYLHRPHDENIVVLCGAGGNGGDGLVVARELEAAGFHTLVVVIAAERYSDLVVHHLDARRSVGKITRVFASEGKAIEGIDANIPIDGTELTAVCREATLVIDALLGVGQSEGARSPIKEIVEILSQLKKEAVVSLDVPTGVDATTGALFDPHIIAQGTVTVEYVKRGMVQYPAREACGALSAVSIGIVTSPHIPWRTASCAFSARRSDAHKGLAGKVLIIGGSIDMPGAPHLTGLAALRAGAGLVTLAVPAPAMTKQYPEIVYRSATEEGYFEEWCAPGLAESAAAADVIVIGPGLGQHPATISFIRKLLLLLRSIDVPIVLDADGLNAVGNLFKSPLSLPHNLILTPHPGEMSRLTGRRISEIQGDRYTAALSLAKACNATVVLKGASTVIGYPEGKGAVCLGGNGYMATPGSGDVLAGIIGAVLGSGVTIRDAVESGVILHARAGDIAAQEFNSPIIASDIINSIRSALHELSADTATHS